MVLKFVLNGGDKVYNRLLESKLLFADTLVECRTIDSLKQNVDHLVLGIALMEELSNLVEQLYAR